MSIDHEYATTIGSRIKDARIAKQLSQRELAEKADVSFSYISEIENGISIPGTQILQRLASALRVRLSALLPD